MKRCPTCGRLVYSRVNGMVAKHYYLPLGADQYIKCPYGRGMGRVSARLTRKRAVQSLPQGF